MPIFQSAQVSVEGYILQAPSYIRAEFRVSNLYSSCNLDKNRKILNTVNINEIHKIENTNRLIFYLLLFFSTYQ